MSKQNRFGYPVGMEFIRHLIDSGRLYSLAIRTAGSTTPLIYRLKTGANRLHVSFVLNAGAKTTIDIIEGATITTAGTAQPLYNHNRNFPDDNLLSKAFVGAAYTGGTIFRPNQAGFGTNPGQAASGDASSGAGYQFKPNTEYIALITPTAGGNDTMFIAEMFETDK